MSFLSRYSIDSTLFLSRTFLFFFIYSVVLGVPSVLWSLFPEDPFLAAGALVLLASAAPFLLFYLQGRIEKKFLIEERRYRAVLIQASAGMGRIKELGMLVKLIVRVVTRAVRVQHSAIYIFDPAKNAYTLGAVQSYDKAVDGRNELLFSSEIVRYLTETKRPLRTSDIQRMVVGRKCQDFRALLDELLILRVAVAVPCMIETRLMGFLLIGGKLSGKPFVSEDLSVFAALANQSALAVENVQFYNDMKATQEQLFRAEKMATIGIMADGLSHQINNRLHAMGFIAGDMKDTLDRNKERLSVSEFRGLEEEFRRGLSRIEENVLHGRNIVQGLMKYTRQGDTGIEACDVKAVFQSALEMAQFKVNPEAMKILWSVPSGTAVRGNFSQLQEVFFNLIDNAYDALMQRKDELREEGYIPTLSVSSNQEGAKIVLYFQDNGIGVKEEDKPKLFTPFFTTKRSSRKGTGLGLYVIRKIVEEYHHGRIEASSFYGQGASFSIVLLSAS